MLIEQITLEDLNLINDLSSRKFIGLSMSKNTTPDERNRFNTIKDKLGNISYHFSKMYNDIYDPFNFNISPQANPITRGNTLHNVWSTFYKGSNNKQYSAQISFVIDKKSPSLNVGFYFGSASAHSLHPDIRIEYENDLLNLGNSLSYNISKNKELLTRYNSLFDIGFVAYSNDNQVLPNEWLDQIKDNPKKSKIIIKIRPNRNGIIDNSTIDFYIAKLIFLMSAVNTPNMPKSDTFLNVLTPEQWGKQAERKAQIGLEGEKFVLSKEKEKLAQFGIHRKGYPNHVSLSSNQKGYDILSLDKEGNEIFIEVKTTTRKGEDPSSKIFFISSNEVKTYEENKSKYKLYRVYDIENNPEIEKLNLEDLKLYENGYYVEY